LTGRTSDSLLMTKISSVTKTVTHLLEEGQRTMSPSVSNLQVEYYHWQCSGDDCTEQEV
jgi:hypothetical protein